MKTAVADLGIEFPVPVDSDHSIWSAFRNEYWPANYFIDARGRVRYHHFGEGDYEKSERVIQELLRENGAGGANDDPVSPFRHRNGGSTERGRAVSRDLRRLRTCQAFRFGRAFGARFKSEFTACHRALALNRWGLGGRWLIGPERSALQAAPGRVRFRFHARDLHMVLGPAQEWPSHPVQGDPE